MSLEFRLATVEDAAELAALNRQLILDEGHRNKMSLEELHRRMEQWLRDAYDATLFVFENRTVGYALCKDEGDWVYLRQLFVVGEFRRQGIGRAAVRRLAADAWNRAGRIRLDVLVGNSVALEFWREVGFQDYCLIMEMERPKIS